MGRTRFYINKLFGRPSVFDFHLLGVSVRLGIASTREIQRARETGTKSELLELMLDSVTSGDTVFDIGSNIGLTSLLLAKHENGIDSTFHCFEPEPKNFNQLKQNIELNNLIGRVHPHQLALGAEDGSVDLHIRGNEGDGRHSIVSDEGADDSITVPLQDMGSFIVQHHVAPDIIKIDVEGAEGQVLAGMNALIGTGVPREIFLQIHPNGGGEFMPDGKTTIEDWLTNRGYTLVWNKKRVRRSSEFRHFTLTSGA